MKNVLLGTLLAAGIYVTITGCALFHSKSDAAWDSPHTIRQYNGGVLIGQWTTVGEVTTESTGQYYFKDARTQQMVTVSGGIQLTMKGAELPLPESSTNSTCDFSAGSVTTTGNGSAAVLGNGNVIKH